MSLRDLYLIIENEIKAKIDATYLDIPTTDDVLSSIYDDIQVIVDQFKNLPGYQTPVIVLLPSLQVLVCDPEEAKEAFNLTNEDIYRLDSKISKGKN